MLDDVSNDTCQNGHLFEPYLIFQLPAERYGHRNIVSYLTSIYEKFHSVKRLLDSPYRAHSITFTETAVMELADIYNEMPDCIEKKFIEENRQEMMETIRVRMALDNIYDFLHDSTGAEREKRIRCIEKAMENDGADVEIVSE
jgi:hypothetical protein